MKFKGLIFACLMIVSSSANATVATPAIAGAVASANISHQIGKEHTLNSINSVNNALDNQSKVLVPCSPRYVGGFFESSRIDRELTTEGCEDLKKKFERLNGVKYRFGRSVAYDNYNRLFFFELIEE